MSIITEDMMCLVEMGVLVYAYSSMGECGCATVSTRSGTVVAREFD
jgi:hypothetical protein